ncbi:hypothetical protein [Candidatus Nitrosotenuis cloacae]|jgi:hypothetical protein|uniref:Arcadin 1 domain-containing protein n=1 Tax=Candidatus Nitrosotenuis cloacae TaxID=1603555 RepID=A0A3G1AYU9_9ARCH|nr:hypothetical protein [Candidatus Nitrosotenuis cloacae]AJZ75078.1 hypothetical protein SU86_000220 [Candidatus Nitrosotenuis cloacae]MDG7050646.1 hypothetical protein [Nitrososphaerota archaeon]
MSDITRYRIQQIVDSGAIVQISLAEDVQTEPISQKQMILDSVAKKLDPELREQVQPLLEAILGAQPTVKIKSYDQTTISITMPKVRYERLGRPQVGEVIEITLSKK